MSLLCFSYNLNHALGWTVVHSLWQALVAAIITGVALILLQKKAARLRYWVANIGLLSVFMAALTTFFMYYDFSKQAGEIVFIPDTSTVCLPNEQPSPLNSTLQTYSLERGFSWSGMSDYCNKNMYLIVTLWFMGVVLFMLRLLGNISYIYYLKNRLNFPAEEYWQETLDKLREKTNLNQYIELVESALVRSPLVVGHLKPMILFPIGAINRLNPNEVEAILAHELAHVMRHDYFFNIIQNVIEALFYFHPAVWWLSSQIRTERENCCDDIAIKLCGNALTYAKALVTVQEIAYFSPQMAMAFAGNNPKKKLLLRVQRLLNQPKSKINIMEKFAATAILLFFVAGLAFGGSHNGDGNSLLNNGLNISSQNTDSQEGTEENKSYIKYEVNGNLDSLPVDKSVKDGQYNFTNNLYDVNMTVKNQFVTAFKINGLEVDRKDMPKFEKMINQLVSSKQEEEDIFASNDFNTINYVGENNVRSQHGFEAQNIDIQNGAAVSYLGDGKIIMVDDQNTISELTIDEKGGRFLLIKKQNGGEPISISLSEDNKTIFLGGKKSNVAAIQKLGWTLTEKGIQPIAGFKNIRPLPPPPPEAPVVPRFPHNVVPPPPPPTPPLDYKKNIEANIQHLRILSNQAAQNGVKAKKLEGINRELADLEAKLNRKRINFDEITLGLDNVTAELDELTAEKDAESTSDFSISYNHSDDGDEESNEGNSQQPNEAYDKWLEMELVKDGYIKSVKKYDFIWTEKKMIVNGNKVSESHRTKYVNQHVKMVGKSLGKNFTITRNSVND